MAGRVNANFIRWAQTGSAATDTYRQFDNGAHSLRNVGQSIQSAVAARQTFIDKSMGAALVSARLGDVNRAAMTSADVTPELQEKMTQEIGGYLNRLKDAADQGTRTRMGWHINGDLITGVRCIGRLDCSN